MVTCPRHRSLMLVQAAPASTSTRRPRKVVRLSSSLGVAVGGHLRRRPLVLVTSARCLGAAIASSLTACCPTCAVSTRSGAGSSRTLFGPGLVVSCVSAAACPMAGAMPCAFISAKVLVPVVALGTARRLRLAQRLLLALLGLTLGQCLVCRQRPGLGLMRSLRGSCSSESRALWSACLARPASVWRSACPTASASWPVTALLPSCAGGGCLPCCRPLSWCPLVGGRLVAGSCARVPVGSSMGTGRRCGVSATCLQGAALSATAT